MLMDCDSFLLGNDFSLQSGTLTLTPTNPQVNQTLSIPRDNIVLEEKEVFALHLQPVPPGQEITGLRGAEVVITDRDGKQRFDSSFSVCVDQYLLTSASVCWGGMLC